MSIDLTQFEAVNKDGEWLEVLHPVTGSVVRDEQGEAMKILLVGQDSQEYKKAQRAMTERRLKNRGKRGRMGAESIENEAVEILIACTKDWSGISLDGEELEFSAQNSRKIYSKYAWLKEQVDEFVDDRANFMKG